MPVFAEFARRLVMLFRRRKFDADLDEEMRLHRELRAQEEIERGAPAEDARYAAQRRFGNDLVLREESRDMWRWNWLEDMLQDFRFGLRMVRKNPGFTAVAVITLAVGIGANTTIFSVAWRPMRYRNSDRLLVVWETRPEGTRSPVSAPTYLDWRDQNSSFDQLAATRRETLALSGNPPVFVSAAAITANFFETFRLQPERGRFFSAEDFRTGSGKVAVLSHEIWVDRFGGDPNIVRRSIRLDGESYSVVGVAPAEFEFFGRMDVWLPLALARAGLSREARDLLVVGSMKPGVTTAQAREEMRTLAARVALASPQSNRRWSALAQSFFEALAGPSVHLQLLILLITVTFVLLMACANVASLLPARGSARSKEIAVRIALGGSRWRVIRQLLVETFFYALLGGLLGLLLAFGAVRYLATLPVLQAPGLAPIEINLTVLEFVAGLCLAATVLCGLVPAWQITATNLMEHVKAASRNAAGDRTQSRLRRGLVTAELALLLLLMVVAGLSARSFIRLMEVDPGFASHDLLAAHVALPSPQYAGPGRVERFYSDLLAAVSAIPGVESAAISTGLPPVDLEPGQPFRLEGRDPASPVASGIAHYQIISTDYFRTLGVGILRGRAFTADDRQGSTAVAIVNHRLAEMYFPMADPIGHRLLVSGPSSARRDVPEDGAVEIVGVVNDVKNTRLSEPASPEVYRPFPQAPASGEYLLVRSGNSTEPMVAAVRNALRSVDPDLPLAGISTMDERLSDALAGGRVVVTLMVIFALMALMMGSVGLYGVVSYSVSERTAEFALRLALGASHGAIFRLVANGALRLLLIGGSVGMLLAVAAARLLGSVLFSVGPYDPVTFLAVPLGLLAVVLTASYLPARRATKVDPMVALRYE